jgi:hypothetical protein
LKKAAMLASVRECVTGWLHSTKSIRFPLSLQR